MRRQSCAGRPVAHTHGASGARPWRGPGHRSKSKVALLFHCAMRQRFAFTIHLKDGSLAWNMDRAAGVGRSVCGMGRRGRPRRLVCVEWFAPLQLAGLLFDFLGVEPQLRADGRVQGCCGSCSPMH